MVIGAAAVIAVPRVTSALECSESRVDKNLDGTSEVICSGATSQRADPGTDGPGGRPTAARPRVAVPDVTRILGFGRDPALGLCYQPSGQTIPTAEFNAPANSVYPVWNDAVQRNFPRCPSAVLTPQEVAVGVVEAFPFPAPQPYIAPGRAITGLRAFLEPRSPTTVSDVRPTPLGEIRLDATGVYYVNWGDAKTGPHPGPGGPWPSGNISHVYTDRGVYDVEVTVAWSVRWQLGGDTGILNVTTQGNLRGLPVEQVQAVRNR